ncbi:YugN family protein [Oceanobacillus saliphilus]|uniref:YugN family protein n=1 Tax=Oceanobacillus saliphilus TaxID=2925834 RepID=UPI00201E4EB8|nr:YugN family protein [Oceanobacillus saliphilus]
MIELHTEIEGKRATFGQMQSGLKRLGYCLCGNWEYDRGFFDGILSREGGETIYIRLPFQVITGKLDHSDAVIEFQTPFVIKHVVNVGLDRSGSSLLTATGFSQFQKPLDTDGHIKYKHKWEEIGERSIEQVMQYISMNVS